MDLKKGGVYIHKLPTRPHVQQNEHPECFRISELIKIVTNISNVSNICEFYFPLILLIRLRSCWQGLGRWSCFLCGVGAIQIHSHIYTLPACILLGLFRGDMDPCSRHFVPLAILPSHNNKTASSPQILSTTSLAGNGLS